MKQPILSFIILLFLFICHLGHAQILYKKQVTLMGSLFEFTLVDKDTTTAIAHTKMVIAEMERIENLISEWRPYTQISTVNQNAGIRPVRVDKEVFELTKRAIAYSQMSNGAFDISIAAMDKIWVFDGSMKEMPSAASVSQSIEKVGYQYILLDSVNQTIFLQRKGMKIGFGSIGKGYAADKGAELLQALGVASGIVNASGDLATWGSQIDKKPWTIGINHPFKPHKILRKFKLRTAAAATSGSYEKFAEIDGTRYGHIINPTTGYPSTGLISVTVYGPSTEFANALTTSIMVLGTKKGIALAKRYPAYKYILVSSTSKIITR